MTQRLAGRSVLVTGASGGLGSVVTQVFLAEGARVAGVARDWPGGWERTQEFRPVTGDLTSPDGVEPAMREGLEHLGRLDAAVHLAGGFSSDGRVEETRLETWDRMMALNARSAFLVFRAALPAMRAAGRGRLIAVGSRAGLEPGAGVGAYAASKAALHALILGLAAELKDTGVTVNAVLPSTIDTEVNRAAMPGADWGKWVKPESIAELLVWLASDASADVNGALIPIYGKS